VFIVSKGGFPQRIGHRLTRKQIMRDAETSLLALGTDFIDAYFFHYDAVNVPAEAIVELAVELQATEKIGVVGYSNFSLERLKQIYDIASRTASSHLSIVSAQMSLPVLNQAMWPRPGSVSISGETEAPTRRWMAEHDLGVFAYSCLGRGFFTQAYWDQVENARELPPPAQSSWLRRRLRWLIAEREPIDDTWLLRKYDSAANRERYRRAIQLAESRDVTAAQIGLAYLFHKNLNVFAVGRWSNNARCDENAAALNITLSADEIAWLEGEPTD
jgi:aryl-alcohol dehydrogenase-like predicted oxidoreductase